jgi:RND family efflux transporter MFP subunit
VVLTSFVAGCAGEAEVTAPPPQEVSISQPLEESVQDTVEFTGRTRAVDSVEVRARVSGYITKVAFAEGGLVKTGDVLFEIDPREYQQAVLRAEGDVAKLRAELTRAQSEVARNQSLRPSGAASARELETAVAREGSTQGDLKARLADLEAARLDLEFTRVTAPISGRASRAEVTVGNLVVVGASGGPLLTTIVSLDPIQVLFDADERSILKIRKAAIAAEGKATPEDIAAAKIPVAVALADETDFPHPGYIDFVDNQVNPSTGTIRVRAELPNPTGLLAPGLFVRVRAPIGDPRTALLVSDRAIGTDQDRKYVLTVNAENVVEYKPVKLGARQGSLRVIEEGLTPKDWVVVNGIQRARPGATVAPQKVAMRGEGTPAAAPPPASS